MKNSETISHKYDLAFIVPNYNSGQKLEKIISKILNTKSDTNFCIIIQDNNSTDSSTSFLSKYRSKNIILNKNTNNIGRIHNWNLSYLCAQKYAKYGVFVFTSDALVNLGGFLKFFNKIRNNNFLMCLFPYIITNKSSKRKIVRKFYSTKLNSKQFSYDLIYKGDFSFGILQANIFNLSFDLKFDNKYPAITDQLSVARYLIVNEGYIYFAKKPFVNWIATYDRYHFKVPIIEFASQSFQLIKLLRSEFNLPNNNKYSDTLIVLRSLNFYLKYYKFNFFEFIRLLLFFIRNSRNFSFFTLLTLLTNVNR